MRSCTSGRDSWPTTTAYASRYITHLPGQLSESGGGRRSYDRTGAYSWHQAGVHEPIRHYRDDRIAQAGDGLLWPEPGHRRQLLIGPHLGSHRPFRSCRDQVRSLPHCRPSGADVGNAPGRALRSKASSSRASRALFLHGTSLGLQTRRNRCAFRRCDDELAQSREHWLVGLGPEA